MAASMHSLFEYGRAFDTAFIAAGLFAAAGVVAGILACAVPGRCACWHRRLAERRYVRAGLRELEHYLAGPPHTGRRG